MANNCFIKAINLNKLTGLKGFINYCGTNRKLQDSILDYIAKDYSSNHLNPKDDFVKWYNEHYKESLDFINGDSEKLKEAILNYYFEKVPSVKDTTTFYSSFPETNNEMYYLPEDRIVAIKYAADTIVSLDKHYFINLRKTNQQAYYRNWLNNKKGLALEYINVLDLSKEDKLILSSKIKISTSSNEIHKVFKEYGLKFNINPNSRSKAFYKSSLLSLLLSDITKRINATSSSSFDNKSVSKMTKGEMLDLLGDDSISRENLNYLQLYWELKTDTDDVFFNKITDNLLDKGITFYDPKSNDQKDTDNRVAEEEAQSESYNFADVEDDNHESIIAAYDHTGLTTDALENIDRDIKAHLSSIKKLNSLSIIEGQPDYDRNNPLGVPEGIDVHKAYGFLYHQVNYDNKESMIRSIRNIALRYPDMLAFNTLADELSEDEDLANLYWNTFAKLVINKTITRTSPDGNNFYISNPGCDIRTTLRNKFLNSVRHAAYNNYNGKQWNAKATYIIDRLKDRNYRNLLNSEKGKEQKLRLISDVCELVKAYYPCIPDESIKSFIELKQDSNKKIDQLNNIVTLATKIQNIIKESNATLNEYNKALNRYNTIYSFNKTLDSLIEHLYNARKKEGIKKEQIQQDLETLSTDDAKSYVNKYLHKSLSKLYDLYSYKHIAQESIESEDYVTAELKNLTIEFADLMLDYILVDADLNSVNAKRNQVSAVINSSYLTNIISILQNEEILKSFGEDRGRSSQYNYSHLMYEHINPVTKEKTYGLFRKDKNGNIIPTEYATDLLKITLFDGASDSVSGKAALYYQMTRGDYLGTGFVNYFDSNDEINSRDSSKPTIKRAGYFMRIPADAKNNFVTSAPKYSADGLYNVSNEDEIRRLVKERIDSIKKVTDEDLKNVVNPQPVNIDDNTTLIDFITNIKLNKDKNLRIPNYIFKNKNNGDEIYVKLQCAENDIDTNNIFIVKGIVNGKKLENVTFVGMASNFSDTINQKLREIIFDALDNKGRVNRIYNTNHPLFDNLKRAFKQEILDMAVAINQFFVTEENGVIARYTKEEAQLAGVEAGSPKFKPGVSNDGNSNPGCYQNFHYNDGVLIKKENGTYKLTGNVFKSNKFTIIDENTGEVINFGYKLVQELLNPLYGGSDESFIQPVKQNGKIIDVDLSKYEDKINEMISNFINSITKDSINHLENYRDNIKDVSINFRNVSEFILNYRLTYFAFDDLFEGNSKIYKSDQDAFKRTKEVQGSGNPMGSPDFTTLFNRKYEKIEDSLLSTEAFKDWGVKQHNQYRAVTVRNTKMTGETIGEFNVKDGKPISFKKIGVLSQQLIDYYKKEGFDDNTSLDKAFEIMSRYYNPKVNDAQSYITFDEFIRRIARRGELYKYKPLIDKIKRGEDLIAEELDEFIQVQKNFQYDQAFDEDAQMFMSRQIKNAEFVLVPQLIKGTELEIVAKLMEKYGIDQLNTEETSKAGKSNILEVFDKNTGLVKQDIIDEIENDEKPLEERQNIKQSLFGKAVTTKHAIQYYNYEYLFTQQETHQHVNDENKAGVQIMKKVVDNIDELNTELWPVKQKLIRLFNENIINSAKDYFSKLGVKFGENNEIIIEKDEKGNDTIKGLNLKKLYDIYKEELRRRRDDRNLLDFATLEDNPIAGQKPTTKLPDFLTLTSKTLEQIAQSSINNNIVRQTLPGFHGPQVTSIGFNSRTINEIGGGKVTRKYSDKLRFYPDGEQYIEAMVSPSFFGLERRKPNGELKSKQELLDELKTAGIDTFIGYRIPTEAKYSVAVMKIVDFVDDAYGSTIIVPNDWVAQTGSDFDVDSIYGITYHTRLDNEGHIEKIEEDKNTKQSRDNGILSCMIKIMQHPSTLEERLLTSNVDHISEAINDETIIPKNVKKAKSNRSQYNFFDQVENHEDAISGMELKAISVAWDGLISIANSVGFYLPKNERIKIRKDGNEIELKQFGDNSENNHRNYEGYLLTAYSAETSPYEFDAIKTGAIPNINKFSFGVFKFLSGLGVDYKLNLMFMSTPGVTRLIKINDKYNSIYSYYSPDVIKKGIEEIAKELNIDTKGLNTDDILEEIEKQNNISFIKYNNDEDLSVTLNIDEISRSKNEKDDKLKKLAEVQTILDFAQIKKLADKFTELSMVLRGDKISAKKSIYETEDILRKCEELANDNTIITKDGQNIISAIFPGLTKEVEKVQVLDIQGFMEKDRSDESKYLTLYSLMRYATIPSIIINKQLFSTENPTFDALIKKVSGFNKNGRSLSPDAKEQLVKYAISEIYGNVFLETTYDNEEIPQNYNREQENARIHGYKMVSEPLEIYDVKNPTDDELEAFKLLSPGEQVLYIQDHFLGEDVFKLLEVELKPYENRGHRIKFNSTNNNLETARRLFSEAFSNNNKLISIAAHNLLKYAFIVEGYSMRKDGISTIVSGTENKCLYKYTDFLRKEFDDQFGPEKTILTSNLAIDFARANTNLLSIPTHYVENNAKNIPELQKIRHIISVPINKYNEDIINKYDLGIDKLVKLRFRADKEPVLYYCAYSSNAENEMYILYPLNKLESFEHGEFSANQNNNKYPSSVYFNNIITKLNSTTSLLNLETVTNIIKTEDVSKHINNSTKIINTKHDNIAFDLNNPTDDIYETSKIIIKGVKDNFNGEVTPSTKFFGIFRSLDKYIKGEGILYGEPQTIKLDENEEKFVTVNIWKVPFKDRSHIAKLVHKGNIITDNNEKYKDVINYIIKDLGLKYLNENVYMITPPLTLDKEQIEQLGDVSELKHSSIRENSVENAAYQSYETVNRIAKLGNGNAARIKELWEEQGIDYNKHSIGDNVEIVLEKSAPLLSELSSTISSKIKRFYKDDNGEWMAINDKRLAPILAQNKDLEQEFLQTLNLVDSISSTNTAIVVLNIDSHDEKIKNNLKSIRSSITALKDNSIVLEAKEMYAKEVLGKFSTNPLINKDLIDIFSPHYSTNWLNSWFSDMLETSNPFAQVLLKKVTDDIYAKDMSARKAKRAFLKAVADLQEEARKAGMSIDFSKFIDDRGIVIQKFNDDLINTLNKFKEEIKETKSNFEKAEGFVNKHEAYKKYLETKLKYDKFLIDHIEQKLVKEYYIARYKLDYNILYGSMTPQEAKATGGFFGNPENLDYPDILVEYKILKAKESELYNIKRKGLLNDQQEKELKQIQDDIKEMTRPSIDFYNDDDYVESKTPLNDEETIKAKIRNPYARQALIHYIENLDKLNSKYFQYDPEFGFEEELDKNLKIIKNRELRDANGNLTKPMSELMEDEEYVRAKLWMRQYTLFVPDEETEAKKNKAFAALGSSAKRATLKRLIRSKDARDEIGTVDARLFTEDEIRQIREEQLAEQMYAEDAPISDRTLISFAKHSDIVYTTAFYAGMMIKDSATTKDWINTAKRINEILSPYYNETLGGIDWRLMGNTISSRAKLRELGDLYRHLSEIHKKEGGSNKEEVKQFFENNVDDTMTQEEIAEFQEQQKIAQSIGEDFYTAWKYANILNNGKINTYLYHALKPKDSVIKKFTDTKKTEALRTLNELYTKDYSEYYYAKYREMKEKGREAFNKWYNENHIYNIRTRKIEPISCWIEYKYNDDIQDKLKYIPKRSKTTKEARPEYVNPNFKESLSRPLNYIEGTGYDNPALKSLNIYEEKMKDLFVSTLHSIVRDKKDHDKIDRGHLLYQRKEEKANLKHWGKEILSTFGWSVNNNGTDAFDEIDYAKNDHLSTPMLDLLDQLKPKQENIIKPERNENETDESYNKRLEEYNKQLAEFRKRNEDRHKAAINKDWVNVIADGIELLGHHNAVEDNYELLHYGRNILSDYQVYVRKFGFFGDYKYDRHNSSEDSPDYLTKKDANIIDQYENYIRRLLLNQWKESNEKITKWAGRLQNLTSAQYMMMNIRGGIANVTLGQTQVVAEANARAIIDEKDWYKSEALYMSAIPSFATHMFDDKASTLIDAIIKEANVVDYDEKLGRARISENPTSKGFGFFRKAMYSPQAMGEHYMQNRVLIASLLSHHIYTEVNPLTGKETVVFKNRGEVISDCAELALLSILNDKNKSRYKRLIDSIKKDPNKAKEFAWFKEDLINTFAKHYLTRGEQKEYIKSRKELEKKALEDFNDKEKHPDVLSQLDLSDDGYMIVKNGSILSKYDVSDKPGDLTDAMKAFASLRNRVVSVNKKIHGVYDKLGQAQIEKKWFGSLVMQYHKHIPIGINKRYRKEGYYNEIRGTVEKGSYVSLIQFLSTPFRKNKVELELTNDEAETLEGIKNIFKSVIDFTTHIGLYWNMLPEYEKANIRRNLGDFKGIVIGIALAVILKGIGDDDDDSIPYNLALYEIDRLRSEAAQFTPTGAINEFKKLWSAPIAAQSGISDLWQTMDVISQSIFGGEDFDPYFRTGRFAGQRKIKVYLERRIPVYRGIKVSFLDINEQNTYYKLRQNVGGELVNNLLDFIDEE